MQCLQSSRVSFVVLMVLCLRQALAISGFLSLDCGATESYNDSATGILWEPDDSFVAGGLKANLSLNAVSPSLETLRYFPGNQSKYCYTLPTNATQRYLARATFLYGSYDGGTTFPSFQISLNATLWAAVTITNASLPIFEEIIFLSTGSLVQVCILKGGAGTPFISTLELRALMGSMYVTGYELKAHLKKSVRINFGALSSDPIRYPDDPVDRIWESDLTRPNHLAGMADGTLRYNTTSHVNVNTAEEQPPEKVMQTAVIGSQGMLTYRYFLEGFPAFAYATAYFAEIQTLGPRDVRAFTLELSNDSTFNGQVVNLGRDVGAFVSFEPGYLNVSLPVLLDFAFKKTPDSNLGPILNAMEIYQIAPKLVSTPIEEVTVLALFTAKSPLSVWANESGDPCVPAPWDWVTCSSTSPPMITGIYLSNKNLTGVIPATVGQLSRLQNLWLDNNFLTGSIPDTLAGLNNLQQLYLQNNQLSGHIPRSLWDKKRNGLDFQFSGNPDLHPPSGITGKTIAAIVGGVVGGTVGTICMIIILWCTILKCRKAKRHKEHLITKPWPLMSTTSETFGSEIEPPVMLDDQIHRYSPAEVVNFTKNFSVKIGQGGFGPVYYGQTATGTELAVKVLSANSDQGAREFYNEVLLLSRIHHRRLVSLLGYAEDDNARMLIYEYMEKGTLQHHLYGDTDQKEVLDWISRLKIALDAAQGLDYLHNGCMPSIIHRDVKSSNILLDKNFEAKVADFGISRLKYNESTIISSSVGGTVGYLDPEYYMTQRLTEKSDVYSFGIVLLEMISGHEPLNPKIFSPYSNIVQWARTALQKGDLESLIDVKLPGNYQIESIWKVAEIAISCVEPFGYNRPTMGQVLKEIQEALDIELDRKVITGDCTDALFLPPSAFAGSHLGYPPELVSDIPISGGLEAPVAR